MYLCRVRFPAFARFLENILAVIGLLSIIFLAIYGGLALSRDLEPKQQPVLSLEPRMARPVMCDATVSQRGAGEKWKTRCYIRKERK